jgi:hypothetical protein
MVSSRLELVRTSWQARNAGAMVAAVRNAPWTIRDGGMPILAS